MNSLDTSFELGGSLLDTTTVNTTSHAVTWSFTTSEDPWTAGSKSDVFVVPNLFVEVDEVYKVFWNNIEPFCKAAVNETENKDAEEDDTDSDDEDNFIDEDDDIETIKEEAEMIALDKEDMLPTNTTLTSVDNGLSPLENAAGVTVIEDEELQKKDKVEAVKKVPV